MVASIYQLRPGNLAPAKSDFQRLKDANLGRVLPTEDSLWGI